MSKIYAKKSVKAKPARKVIDKAMVKSAAAELLALCESRVARKTNPTKNDILPLTHKSLLLEKNTLTGSDNTNILIRRMKQEGYSADEVCDSLFSGQKTRTTNVINDADHRMSRQEIVNPAYTSFCQKIQSIYNTL
jgi:hypothetical protein